MNIGEALRCSALLPTDSAKLDTEVLLAFTLAQSRTYLYTWPERELTHQQELQFNALMMRRADGEPVAYIVGTREFWSLPLQVGPSTLIPRPDTEVLIEVALNLFSSVPPLRILDLGTGTGAIALVLAKEFASAMVEGVDFNPHAVELAGLNAKNLNITNVQFFQSNWFSAVSGSFDLIVSNPPYIDSSDPHLTLGDVRFEPASALVASDNGFADLAFIIEQTPKYLNNGGWLILEHGCEQAAVVCQYLKQRGFTDIFTERDYGGNDRISGGRWRIII